MARTKKTKKTTAPRTRVVQADATPTIASVNGIELGSPVFVRWEVGRYKLGILTSITKEGKPVVRLGHVNPHGMYTGDFGAPRTFEPNDIDRAMMRREWETIGRDESAAAYDARTGRAPMAESIIESLEDAEDVATLIVRDDAVASRETVRSLARWTIEAIGSIARWRAQHDALEDALDAANAKLESTAPRETRLVEDANGRARQTVVRKGDYISVKTLDRGKKQWHVARVELVSDDEVHFVEPDGNGGSRPTGDEGNSWLLLNQADGLAKFSAAEASRLPSTNDATPDARPVIDVKVGRRWEGVRVTRITDALVAFTDGITEGTRLWSTFGKDWRVPMLPALYHEMEPDAQHEACGKALRACGANPHAVVVEAMRQAAERCRASAEDTAKAAEAERRKVDGQGKRAARKATNGTAKPLSPVDRAVADSKASASNVRVPKVDEAVRILGAFATGPYIDTKVIAVVGDKSAFVVMGGLAVRVDTHGKNPGWCYAPEMIKSNAPEQTLHQRNMAEAKRRGVPVWQVVEEQEKAANIARANEATESVRATVARDADEVADDEELAVASERELEALGKRRTDGGDIVDAKSDPWGDIEPTGPSPWDDVAEPFASRASSMPWED